MYNAIYSTHHPTITNSFEFNLANLLTVNLTNMKNLTLLVVIICSLFSSCSANKQIVAPIIASAISSPITTGEYTLVLEGFDWGAAASKVILSLDESSVEMDASDFEVQVNRSTSCAELSPAEASGQLKVLHAYNSDAEGKRSAAGKHLTLALFTAPFEQLNSPIKYFAQNPNCKGNQWIDFDLTITNKKTQQVWDAEINRIIPLIDEFDLAGNFAHGDISLPYASYEPETKTKSPLIIWLHGGGEGGQDPSIPLLANRAANYASPEIQSYFGGAYVLVPQSPTFWMDKGDGSYTRGDVNDMYNESLMALIKNYADQHKMIDQNRIYLGGCSNGGYMTLKLLLLHPDYFAAGFPSALAYHEKNLTDNDIQSLKDQSIWFIHSSDDPVTVASETATPTYERLIAAGAQDVHYSLFDHVVDITNQFGGKDYHYMGHFSWIYSHANKCQLDYDGSAVKVDGYPVTLMGWLARQSRQ